MMSNPLAIAAVTTTFRQLLMRVTEETGLQGATVTTRTPDRARANSDTARQLNLFLYQVTPNTAWRDMDLPVRDSAGNLANLPTLALNLQYLVTAYGQGDDDVDAHHLLAYAMSLVYDQPVLTRDQVRAAITGQTPLSQSDLADQVELVKLGPHALTPDDLYKLWSTFQAPYRLSVAYDASVVLIARPHQPKVAPPVRATNLYVLPMRRPVIDTVTPQVLGSGATLTMQGHSLQAAGTQILIGSIMVAPSSSSDTQIAVQLPGDLTAGVQTAQVIQPLDLGTPPASHPGYSSTVVAFLLTPQITTPSPLSVARGQVLTLAFTPAVAQSQQVSLLIGDQELALPARAAGTPPVSSLPFTVPSTFPTGTFLLRLRVDGADSPLTVDTDSNSPTFNQYNGPQVTIT
jgi:hypothetical protein